MNIALWVLQVLLAGAFGMAGTMKIIRSKEELAENNMDWVEDFSETQIKGIGVLEILGAIGVILPMLTNILPWLTAWAAAGLALVMVGAAVTHTRRGENQMIAINAVLFLLAIFVAIGRFPA